MEFNQSLNHNTCIAAPTVLKVSKIQNMNKKLDLIK